MADTTLTGQISNQTAAAILRDPGLTQAQYASLVQGAANRTLIDAQAGLGGDIRQQAVKQLPTKQVTVPIINEENGQVEGSFTRTEINTAILPGALTPVYSYSDSGANDQLTGYSQVLSLPQNWDPAAQVTANYDVNGALTNYTLGASIQPVGPDGQSLGNFYSSWDADGKPKLTPIPKRRGGFFGGLIDAVIGFVNDLGPIGQIALAYATAGIATEVAALLNVGATTAGVITNGVFQLATTGNIDLVRLAVSPLVGEAGDLAGIDVADLNPILKNVGSTVVSSLITGDDITLQKLAVSAAMGAGSTFTSDTSVASIKEININDSQILSSAGDVSSTTPINTLSASSIITSASFLDDADLIVINPSGTGEFSSLKDIPEGLNVPVVVPSTKFDAFGNPIDGEMVTKAEAVSIIKDAFAELSSVNDSLLKELKDSGIKTLGDVIIEVAAYDGSNAEAFRNALDEAKRVDDAGITIKTALDVNAKAAQLVSRFAEQNIELVTTPIAGSELVELSIFRLSAVIDVYLDADVAKAAGVAIDRAGGDISQADLRYSNLLDIVFETKNLDLSANISNVASDPYTAGKIITVEEQIDLGVEAGGDFQPRPVQIEKIAEILKVEINNPEELAKDLVEQGATLEDLQQVTGLTKEEITRYFVDNDLPVPASNSKGFIAQTIADITSALDELSIPKPKIDLSSPQGIKDILKFFTEIGLPIPSTLLGLVAGGANLFGSKASDLVASAAGIVTGGTTAGNTVANNLSSSVKTASNTLYANAISQATNTVTTTTSQLTAATTNLALAQTNTEKAKLDLQIATAAGASTATIVALTAAVVKAENTENSAGLIVNGLSANEIGAFQTLLYNENQLNASNSTSAFILANSASTFDDETVLPVGYSNDGNLLPGYQLDEENNPVYVGTDFSYNDEVFVGGFPAYDDDGNLLPGYDLDEANNPVYVGFSNLTGAIDFLDSVNQEATLNLARKQASIASQRKQINNSDWRVRLRLAPTSQYLYNAPSPGILQPLKNTDGVIFPYTPKIETSYRANYNSYDLTHSNYRGYFYQNSFVDPVNISCDFTAQDTSEADYLLAVMHFFKSATKMFYGQDAERGAPPPLVYLSGLGEYQFNEHPLVISQFNLSLPNDVDYIRAGSTNINGTDLLSRRLRQNLPTNPLSGALQRLYNLGQNISKGAEDFVFAPPSLGENRPTYVPTKMNITLTLLPVQSRAAVSKQFSLKSFANGDLIRGGFW